MLLSLLLLSSTVFAGSSLYERGLNYYYGQGVEKNYNKAANAFKHALKLNDLDAQTALGLMYIQGHGVD